MPSLVNFQPLIDASLEASRSRQRAAEIRAKSIQQGFDMVSRGIATAGERGRKREREFNSMFDFDLNKNANVQTRGYLADRYNQIKRDGINMFKDNKDFLGYGKLTPEQRIELDDKLDSFEREANTFNVNNELIQKAEDIQNQRRGSVEVDNEKVGRYLDLLTPDENGKYDVEGMAKFLGEMTKSPTGNPYTKFTAWDPEEDLKSKIPLLQEKFKKVYFTNKEKVLKNGKAITETYETIDYGSEDQIRSFYFESLNKSKDADRYNAQLAEQLTEQEKMEAIAQYGNKQNNPFSAYWAFNKADFGDNFKRQEHFKEQYTAPDTTSKTGAGGGGDFVKIPKTEIGYEFGTTPIPITKPINGTTYKNASVVSVKEDDNGNYFAEVVVPRGQNESFTEMIAKRESQGGDISNTEATNFLMEMLNDNKVKTIEVPLEDIFNELSVGFKKKKIYLPGYEDITFKPKETSAEETDTEDNWDEYLRK